MNNAVETTQNKTDMA